VRTDKSFALNDAILALRGRAAWAHNFDTDRSIVATFQSLPDASFVVDGAAQARDAALVTAAAEMTWANGFAAAAIDEYVGQSNASPIHASRPATPSLPIEQYAIARPY
jgi:uncharacterized protein with beta-barrel porin domain